MRPKVCLSVIGAAFLLLSAMWAVAPKKAAVIHQPQLQPKSEPATRPVRPKARTRPVAMAQTEEVPILPAESSPGEPTETNAVNVPEGYRRIEFAVSGSEFAVKPKNQTNKVQ